jgi:hypothetical protein
MPVVLEPTHFHSLPAGASDGGVTTLSDAPRVFTTTAGKPSSLDEAAAAATALLAST